MDTDTARTLRLGLAPILALAWALAAGDPVPFLGPVLAANILMMSQARPPLPALLRLFLAVMLVTLGVTWLTRAFAETPAVLWTVLLALTTGCFARLARAPRDVVGLLALVVTAVVTALVQVSADLAAVLPWVMARAYLQACIVALLAFAIWPGATPTVAPAAPPATPPLQEGWTWTVLGKAVGMLAALGVAILLEDTSATLVAITVTNVLRDPDPAIGRGFGLALLKANLWAGLLAMPVLLIAALQPPLLALIPAASAGALWLAAGLGRGSLAGTRARIGLPAYLTLLGLLLPKAGEGAGLLLADRLTMMALAVAYAIAVLALVCRR